MRITKFEHACVRVEHDAHRIVIDPGTLTTPEAVDGATAVLITHEHADHYAPDTLRRTDAPVFTIAAVAAKIREDAPDVAERVTVVEPGQHLDVGVPVEVVGRTHAEILPDLHFDNSGYLLDVGGTRVFHPGDALTVPDTGVDLLLLPVSAPWLKASECIGFARDVGASRSLAIHDLVYSDFGLGVMDTHLRRILEPAGQAYERLRPGEDLGEDL
ncbi:MAG TPA: MBL fold metallo-hydrolase [Marmoricola sp.]|jgi:L-ascorbate metabolism protein UlaG (beta-lactamase superfamily)|nr:MBL fold metallo-hydrolase [Marmoricola sp.]